MRDFLKTKRGGFVGLLLIAGLVIGGLGWVTAAALRLEQQQLWQAGQVELSNRLRVALWRLDSRVFPVLAQEASRPYHHYSAVYAPPIALQRDGNLWSSGTVLEPSPLLDEELPDWMLLHFQTDNHQRWRSPQVLSPTLASCLVVAGAAQDNVTSPRGQLLSQLAEQVTPDELLAELLAELSRQPRALSIESVAGDVNFMLVPPGNNAPQEQVAQANQQVLAQSEETVEAQSYDINPNAPEQQPQQMAANEYQRRLVQQQGVRNKVQTRLENDNAYNSVYTNGEAWFTEAPAVGKGQGVLVRRGGLVPLWLDLDKGEDRLVMARQVQIGDDRVVQGVVVDWPRLREFLQDEVRDLFPQASMLPLRDQGSEHPERAMTALPIELDPGIGAVALTDPGMTALRIGLLSAWSAALVALLAVGLGGWSLLDLSERRIRFVSAVTHELRTPLTTLRLYLDMLSSGMVTDEQKRTEYLQTLNGEANRLNRLIANVLDFSRLENQRPQLQRSDVDVQKLLGDVHAAWTARCQETGKQLEVESDLPEEFTLDTDGRMVEQILGNLVDNACKYTRDADDPRIWLRARLTGERWLEFTVEDRGPGVPLSERRRIFLPFRQGRKADPVVGGAGLGLALAQRWARLLGGSLTVSAGENSEGACFCLRLPAKHLAT